MGRAYERVRSVLVVEDVLKVQSFGFDRADKDLSCRCCRLTSTPGEDGTGRLVLTLGRRRGRRPRRRGAGGPAGRRDPALSRPSGKVPGTTDAGDKFLRRNLQKLSKTFGRSSRRLEGPSAPALAAGQPREVRRCPSS